MSKVRIIPRLDIKGPNLVKGIHLEGLRVLGKPERFAKFYYENGADELFFQDAVASLYDRNSLSDIISKTAKEIFIPLTVGGGIRTIQDIKNVLRAGADKVAINTAAIKNPEFIREASLAFGSSTIVVAIEAIKQSDGQYLAYTDNGREESGFEVVSWAKRVAGLGAGEIVITSVDKEGTGEGFDLKLVKMIAETVSIPVIAHGGCSSPKNAAIVINEGWADAVAVSSILHYDTISKLSKAEENFDFEGNTSFMESGMNYSKIKPYTILEIKKEMKKTGITVRV
jgi:imidazole glycerol-phosphate synthase subunit HisF